MAGEIDVEEFIVKIDPAPVDVDTKPDVVVKTTDVKDPAVADLVNQYKELEEESKRRKTELEAANQRAAAAQREAEEARREATSSRLDTVTTAMSGLTAAMEAAKRDKKVARDAGDWDAEIEADQRLTQAQIDARTFDEAKADLEERKKQPPQPLDPVEKYVANRSEPTAKWLREHRDFVLDLRKNQKLTAAHYDAVAEGHATDTKEYFEHVEKFVGIKKEVTEGDDVQRAGAVKKPVSERRVAPVNGSARSSSATGGTEVRLSAREAEAATDGTHIWNYDDPSGQKKFKKGDAIGVQEFARRKAKLTEQGAYDRTYETQ